ncbi:MAG: hypothetical protein IKT44_04580 [Clostridia bacterium]|nr:hypothetical protein [Clostridia bacterium]
MRKFKNGLHYKVEPLKTYEIDLPKKDVIHRLIEQDGFCRNQDSNGYQLEFNCYKDGFFLVIDPGFDRQVFLQGYVGSEMDKTIVKVETVKAKGRFLSSVISTVICFIISIIIAVFTFSNDGFTEVEDFLKLAVILVLPILSISAEFKEKKAIPVDTDIMLNEIENRINGVIRWDD